MPRLFTGIEIPGLIGDQSSRLRGGLPGARWIDRENLHLTLRFVGDVDMDIAEKIAGALARVHRAKFTLKLADIGVFGTKRPHSIVARTDPSTELGELQADHERLMKRIGLRPETRKFTPHVTLARLGGANGRDIGDYLSARGGFVAGPFLVERFVLFSARDSIGGGPYVIEEVYPLVAPGGRPELDARGIESWQNN